MMKTISDLTAPSKTIDDPAVTVSISAPHFLETAVSTMRERAVKRDAGDGERSMARAVKIFNAWTDSKISEKDGWRFMIALKQAREIQGEFHGDDYIDLAAYAALLGETESKVSGLPRRDDNGD